MITRLIVFHESGIPLFSWPKDDESTSIFASFMSALQQFVKTYFSQEISLVGLQKENVVIRRQGEYILAIAYVDLAATQLINDIAREIMNLLKPKIDGREIYEMQLSVEYLANYISRVLEEAGVLWLLDLAEYIYKTASVVGVSIFAISDSQAKPLYIPLEPILGFNKVVEAISVFPRLKNEINRILGKFERIKILAGNRGLEYWVGKKYVALLEHEIEEREPLIGEIMNSVLLNQEEITAIYNYLASLAFDILGELPEIILVKGKRAKYAILIRQKLESRTSSISRLSVRPQIKH